MCQVLELTFDLRQGLAHLSCYVGELQVCVLSPGPLVFGSKVMGSAIAVAICSAVYLVLTF